MPNKMYECEMKKLFMENGVKVWKWVVRPVSSLGSGGQPGIRCMHCHGAVRVHKQAVEHGPSDHVEHLLHDDSERCLAGHHFQGVHQMSGNPVE